LLSFAVENSRTASNLSSSNNCKQQLH